MPRKKLWILYLSIFMIGIGLFLNDSTVFADKDDQGDNQLIYIIPIEREVERGLESFLRRSVKEATEEGANHIIFEIDTPGGLVDAAKNIASILQSIEVPTTSYVVSDALSAGSYIALNTDNIYMAPHASIGASGVITSDGSAADKKAQSAWLSSMIGAAESKGRDPLYAEAMADETIDLPEYNAGKGEFLTLFPAAALEVGYSEGTVQNRQELLYDLGLSKAAIVETKTTFAEEIARFVTSPIVIPILLSVASLGLILELYSPGFGVPGSMGLVALLLFFYGHVIAGLAGLETIILLLIGLGLIVAEFFVTGGILGLLGVGAILGSLFMAGYDVTHMSLSIAIAFIVAIIVGVVLYKFIGLERGIFKRLILRDQTTTELGYVSSVNRHELVGLEGKTITGLRPAGIVDLKNERIDVVSEGSFIDSNERVKVVKVEGMRIVVRRI